MSTTVDVPHRYPPKLHFIYLFNKYKYWIFWTLYILSVFFFLQNSVCFIILTHLVPVLFTFYIFIQQIQVPNILNIVYTLSFFSLKCSLFHNSNVFGSCIIHILFIQQILVPNTLNMVYILRFFPSKRSLFHNSNAFGSCIIHILYIYSTNTGNEHFKHGIYSPFFSLQNAVCFIILTYLVPVLFTFYIFIQ